MYVLTLQAPTISYFLEFQTLLYYVMIFYYYQSTILQFFASFLRYYDPCGARVGFLVVVIVIEVLLNC